jgi:hypothetical protein
MNLYRNHRRRNSALENIAAMKRRSLKKNDLHAYARLDDVSAALAFQAFEDRSASNLLFTLPSAHRETISDSSCFRNCENMKPPRRSLPTV